MVAQRVVNVLEIIEVDEQDGRPAPAAVRECNCLMHAILQQYAMARANASTTSERYSRYLNQAPLAMTGIGTDKAFRIWFRALSTKFSSATNHVTARAKVLAAAQAMYGMGSGEANAVQRASAAMNVGLDAAE